MALTHPFVSGISDDGDATLVRPTDWNAGHTGTLDHGADLTGLADDDHTQYVLADGTRNITGALTITDALTIDGSADLIQLLVQGHSTQASLLAVFEDSAGLDQTTFGVDGAAVFNEQGNDADFRIEGDTESNLLFVDASTDRVGFGENTPLERVHVAGNIQLETSGNAGFFIKNTSATFGNSLVSGAVGNPNLIANWTLAGAQDDATKPSWIFGLQVSNDRMDFRRAPAGGAIADLMRLDALNNLLLGTTSIGTSADTVIGIANGVAPSSSPANMVQLYAEDISASSELRVRDEAGNVTTLSPHPTDYLNILDTRDQIPWAYHSRNDYLGKEIYVNMGRFIRRVIRIFEADGVPIGDDIIMERDIPKRDWDVDQETMRIQRERDIVDQQNDKAETEAAGRTFNELMLTSYVKKTIPLYIERRLTRA